MAQAVVVELEVQALLALAQWVVLAAKITPVAVSVRVLGAVPMVGVVLVLTIPPLPTQAPQVATVSTLATKPARLEVPVAPYKPPVPQAPMALARAVAATAVRQRSEAQAPPAGRVRNMIPPTDQVLVEAAAVLTPPQAQLAKVAMAGTTVVAVEEAAPGPPAPQALAAMVVVASLP